MATDITTQAMKIEWLFFNGKDRTRILTVKNSLWVMLPDSSVSMVSKQRLI